MSTKTYAFIFAQNEAVRPAYGSGAETHTVVESPKGVISIIIDLGSQAHVKVNKHAPDLDNGTPAFATVTTTPLQIQITPDTVDSAIALRDALTETIRYAKRHRG